jgi:hypothetical protein
MPHPFISRFLSWFTRPASPVPLAWFRVAIALFCLLQLFAVRGSFLEIYGQYGFVQWAITRANLLPGLPHLGDVALWLGALGLNPDQAVYVILGVYLVAVCGLLAGAATRLMAVVAWCIHYLWIHAGGGMVYGMDVFTHIGLLYCMFMPVGDAMSFDAVRYEKASQPSVAAGVTQRMLQLHLAMVYLSSGLEKASGIQWWNGEAIWRAVSLPTFHQMDLQWLASVPWFAMLSCWLILAIEIGYGVAIWSCKTRAVWLGLVLGMHLMIGVLMGMWLFALIMIIFNLGAFGSEVLADLQHAWNRVRPRLTWPAPAPRSPQIPAGGA